jgi:hypothetical protein
MFPHKAKHVLFIRADFSQCSSLNPGQLTYLLFDSIRTVSSFCHSTGGYLHYRITMMMNSSIGQGFKIERCSSDLAAAAAGSEYSRHTALYDMHKELVENGPGYELPSVQEIASRTGEPKST